MTKWLKAIMALGAVVILVIVALVVLIQTQLTPERVRATLLPLAEEQLGRQVQLGEIHIGLFTGVTITDLKVMEADGTRLFLAVGSSRLSYRLWPLLAGRLVIREIVLEQPVITLIRLEDGTFNFSDLLPDQAVAGDDAGPQPPPATDAGAGLIELLIQEVAIRGGQVTFVDRLINPQAPFRYALDQFDLRASQITLQKAFPVEVSAQLNGTSVRLSGQIDPLRSAGDMALRCEPLDLIPFAPYYRASLPGTLGAARLLLNIDLDWTPQAVSSRGKVTLEQVDLVLAALPDAPLRGVRLGADYAVTLDLTNEQVEISTLLLQLNEIRARMEGRFNLSPEPQLDAMLTLDRLDLRQALTSLPQGLARQLQPFSPAGELDARVRLFGPLNAGAGLVHSAEIKLLTVQATIDTLRAAISGDLTYAGQSLRSNNVSLRYGDQQATLTFELQQLMQPPVTGTFALTAREVDINALLPPEDDESPGSAAQTPSAAAPGEPGPFDLPVAVSGTVHADLLRYKRLSVTPFDATLTLENNRLTIDPLVGQVAGGTFNLSSVVDLGVAGLAYQGRLVLSGTDLAALVSGLFPLEGKEFGGRTQWTNQFSGRGTTKDKILRSLQLDGQLSLLQGMIAGLPLQNQLSAFLDSPHLKSISFREFQGNYRMRDGRIRLDSQLDGSQVRTAPVGTLGIDGTLELKLPIGLSPEIMGRMGASDRLKQAFVDDSGWGLLPLVVGGSLTSPRVGFDTEVLQKQAVDQAAKALEKRLLEKLTPDSGEDQNREPVRNLLDNTLRRLRLP